MNNPNNQSCPTIAAFQRENACRQDMDEASYECAFGVDAEDTQRLKVAHSTTVSLWLDAIEKTRAAHIAAVQLASDSSARA